MGLMKIIQILLLFGFGVITFLAKKQISPATKATARLGLLFLSVFLIVSIIFPKATTLLANFLGVGRGTDLVIYCTTFGLLAFAIISLTKYRKIEREMTRLVRSIALNESQK